MTSSGAGREQGSLLPSALVGLGILLVVGLFIFWPGGDGSSSTKEDATAQRKGSGNNAAGIGERRVDPAADRSRAASAATQRSRGLAEPGEATEAPEPKTLEGKIEAKKRQIKLAELKVEQIEAGLERYPKIREEALANSDNVEFTTRNFDRKKERMELNLERAKADVEAFTAELEDLESEG